LAFEDSIIEKFTPIYKIISEENFVVASLIDTVSAALTEYELWVLLRSLTEESTTINDLFDKLLTWYQ